MKQKTKDRAEPLEDRAKLEVLLVDRPPSVGSSTSHRFEMTQVVGLSRNES